MDWRSCSPPHAGIVGGGSPSSWGMRGIRSQARFGGASVRCSYHERGSSPYARVVVQDDGCYRFYGGGKGG
jgi:hypothetical protein